jgi:hypothetical protein
VTSPFAVYAHVVDGKCVDVLVVEDTRATTEWCDRGGGWPIHSDPDAGEVIISASLT